MRIAKIVGLGIVVVVAGAYALKWAGYEVWQGTAAPIVIPSACAIVPEFPPGARLTDSVRQSFSSGATTDTIRADWKSVTFYFACHCDAGSQLERAVSEPAMAARLARDLTGGSFARVVSRETRRTAPAPGFELVALRADRTAVTRGRSAATGTCMVVGYAREPHPVKDEFRAVTDQWFGSWQFRDRDPLGLVPLSDAWHRRRLD